MQAMPIRIFLILFILFLIRPYALQAATEQRIALVIGNSAYISGPLKNPVNDATAIAAMLKKLGFTVTLKKNAKQQEMDESIRKFGRQLKRTRGVGLFYYAGHGMQIGGVNYLLPVNARIEKESDVRFQSVNADIVLAEMENAENGLNIVILDACRDNPFSRSFRNAARGLAIISNAPSGTFISYSTGANQVARDGEGKNSPYTRALLENMDKPGLSINNVFMKVRSKLKKETGQIPWELSSLEGDFFFVPGTATKVMEDLPSGKAATDRDEISLPKSASTDELDDESRKLEEAERKLEKASAVLKPESLKAERKKLKAWRYRLEEKKKKLAMGTRPSVSTANEISRDGRFIAYDNGTVLDAKTGLMWAARDNGLNINWANAKSYCENYRGGGYTDWRMPTRDGLAELYNSRTEQIKLTDSWVWAASPNRSKGELLQFNSGGRLSGERVGAYDGRTLPVRSGK